MIAASFTAWIPRPLRRILLIAMKLGWVLLVLALIAAIGLLLLLKEGETPGGDDSPYLVEREGRWQTVNQGLARQSWPSTKAPNSYRVFLFGGSQAFGAPYVHRDQLASSRLLEWLEVPNRGGIATWLEAYLQHLMPDREVQVINLAVPGAPVSTIGLILPTVLAEAEPDLLLVLSGNNEGSIWDPNELKLGEAFDAYLGGVEEEYRGYIESFVAGSRRQRVPLWLLTVPTNLRDHLPTDTPTFEIPPALEAANAGDCDEVAARTEAAGEDHAVAFFLRARCLDRSGKLEEALPLYEAARARDKIFQRVRPELNELLRGYVGQEGVEVIDLDATVRRAARDGIPGDDLFIDSCHMRLSGYRLMALELARHIGEAEGVEPQRLASLPGLEVEVMSADELSRLHLVKRLKWLRLRLLSAADSTDWINRDRFARNFQMVDDSTNDFFTAIDRLEKDLPAMKIDPPTGSTDPE